VTTLFLGYYVTTLFLGYHVTTLFLGYHVTTLFLGYHVTTLFLRVSCDYIIFKVFTLEKCDIITLYNMILNLDIIRDAIHTELLHDTVHVMESQVKVIT
jgi:hypothetical protein